LLLDSTLDVELMVQGHRDATLVSKLVSKQEGSNALYLQQPHPRYGTRLCSSKNHLNIIVSRRNKSAPGQTASSQHLLVCWRVSLRRFRGYRMYERSVGVCLPTATRLFSAL
jgi:hypothetical protein